jgi:hypothetical protein
VHLSSVKESDGKAAGTPLQPPAAAGASAGQERQSTRSCVVFKHSVVSQNTRVSHVLQPKVLLSARLSAGQKTSRDVSQGFLQDFLQGRKQRGMSFLLGCHAAQLLAT